MDTTTAIPPECFIIIFIVAALTGIPLVLNALTHDQDTPEKRLIEKSAKQRGWQKVSSQREWLTLKWGSLHRAPRFYDVTGYDPVQNEHFRIRCNVDSGKVYWWENSRKKM